MLISTIEPAVYEFIYEALKLGYTSRGIPENIVRDIIILLKNGAFDPSVYKSSLPIFSLEYYKKYNDYKRIERPEFIYRNIKTYLINSMEEFYVLDIGCGLNTLCNYIANKEENLRCIGVDIVDYSLHVENSRVCFIKQSDPDLLPVSSQSINVAILANVLHHLQDQGIRNILAEAKRVLIPGGILIIFEDTWDEGNVSYRGGRLYDMFSNLSCEQKRTVICLMDWIGSTLPVADTVNMAHPYSFKGMNDWSGFVQLFGFRLVESEFLGFPSEKLHLNPQGKLVLQECNNV